MAKLVVTEFVSLDGVFEDPGGAESFKHGGWTFAFNRGDDGDAFKLEELMAADAQLLGRVTYEGFAKAWPTLKDEAGFAERMNAMPKYVVSRTLQQAEWNNTTIVATDGLADRVRDIKTAHTGDILVAGSGTLVQFLLNEGLVDEIRLMMFPVVLGSGRQLFEGCERVTLRLRGLRTLSDDGVTLITYAPDGVTAATA